MVEILAGGQFYKAVRDLELTSAIRTYHSMRLSKLFPLDYQVWVISDDDYTNLCSIDDEDWKDDWGWWRHSDGSNLGPVNHECVINGLRLDVWNITGHVYNIYPDILSYLCDELGVGTETNVCACATDLAQQNELSLTDLFKLYLD